MTDTVLIIGGRLQAIEKAQRLGLRVVLLQHRELLLPGQAEAADAMLLADYLDWDIARPLVTGAHDAFGFAHAVSLVDQGMELVGRVNDLLGLVGTSHEVARRFRDKLVMRRWLRERGFETVAAAPVQGPDALAEFAALHGYPVVLKPVDGAASRGVVRVDDPDDAALAWNWAAGLRGRTDLAATFHPVGRLMVEEWVDGPEYSAETFSFDGRHVVVSFTEKMSEGVVEIGHAEPARLAPADEAALERYVTRYLDVMGLRDGVSHVEVKLSPVGPRIIEGHDRPAGDRITDLVAEVYGIDLEAFAVGWPFRRVPELDSRPAPYGAAATRFLTAKPGVVTAVEGVDEVRSHPNVLDVELSVAVGSEVTALSDNLDRSGQVLVRSADTAGAVRLCAELAKAIGITTIPEPG